MKWCTAFAAGATVTGLQLAAVAALNDGKMEAERQQQNQLRSLTIEEPPERELTPTEPVEPELIEEHLQERDSQQADEELSPHDSMSHSQLGGLAPSHGGLNLGSLLPSLVEGGTHAGRDAEKGGAEPDRAARPAHRPTPQYPPEARRKRIEGIVLLRLRVETDGNVSDVVVVEANPPGIFEAAAKAAARGARFDPAIIGGQPQATTVEQRIVFRLR